MQKISRMVATTATGSPFLGETKMKGFSLRTIWMSLKPHFPAKQMKPRNAWTSRKGDSYDQSKSSVGLRASIDRIDGQFSRNGEADLQLARCSLYRTTNHKIYQAPHSDPTDPGVTLLLCTLLRYILSSTPCGQLFSNHFVAAPVIPQ
jgi:hypothetical protein